MLLSISTNQLRITPNKKSNIPMPAIYLQIGQFILQNLATEFVD